MSETSYYGGERHYDHMRPWPERALCSSMEVSHFLWIIAVVVLLSVVFVLTAVIVRLMNKGKEGRVKQSTECIKEATYDDALSCEKLDNENNLTTIWTSGAPDPDCTGVVYDELPEILAKHEGQKERVVYHELPEFISAKHEGQKEGVVYHELPEFISAKHEGQKERVVYHELPDFISAESEGRVYFDDEGNRV